VGGDRSGPRLSVGIRGVVTCGRQGSVIVNPAGRDRVYVKRIIGLLVIALLVFWVFISPDSAAGTVRDIAALLREGADSVIRFFTQVV
jgi:hypothetical protein